MQTIIVDEALCLKIEALQYEVESRKDVIAQILSGGFSINGTQFAQYQEEYKNFFIQYNKAKQELVNTYNIGENKSWNLNFGTRELTIE